MGVALRAVQYVRMSTEHQQYSTENQSDVIAAYAAKRGIEIVGTFADEGRSGLSLDGRPALKNLLAIVESGEADFSIILVYDISRWGRFQDADESAYYEYICRKAGVSIAYCAEQFDNDGSPASTIFKSVKRTMAGEYSRELSVKVFAGQCRLIELGFRQGGLAGYGLRRCLVDHAGARKGTLEHGQHKSIQTDRVVLIPGPAEEADVVRWIFRSFAREGKSEREIADALNKKGVTTDLDRQWSRGTVHQLLTNEKYIGNNVWNRRSFKLKKKRVRNERDTWLRADGAFVPIVDKELFEAAQEVIRTRSVRRTDAELLQFLRDLLSKKGYLSGLTIDEMEDGPSSSIYRSRFGSLLRAYQLVGYTPDRDYEYIAINRFLRSVHPNIVQEVRTGIERFGGRSEVLEPSGLLRVNEEFTVSVVVARCRETPSGSLRWHIHLDSGLFPDFTIAVRMNTENRRPRDYYILPWHDLSKKNLRLAKSNGITIDCFRCDTLEPIWELAARVKLSEAA